MFKPDVSPTNLIKNQNQNQITKKNVELVKKNSNEKLVKKEIN
jgi:hypothetical protein